MDDNSRANCDSKCPCRAELSAFSMGKLPVDELERVAAHVAVCLSCENTLSSLDEETDILLEEIQMAGQPAPFDDAECDRVVALVEAIGLDSFSRQGENEQQSAGTDANLGMLRDYRLLEKLGEGGMGTVYKALHTKLDTHVAIKVLAEERMRDSASVARFEREMKAVGKLRHPNIVQAFDAGEEHGTHYLVMEYVDGLDLSKLVEQIGPLPIADACELIRQAAVGLQAAYEAGLVHRDIKTSNLMLASNGIVKILDLGLARLQTVDGGDNELTSNSQIMGTADYMSPEQAKETHTVDIRADIYSLGCTLYKLLSGQPPFCSPNYNTPLQRLAGHMRDPVPSVQYLRPDVPDDLATVIDGMLAKAAEDRPATPADVAAALAPLTHSADLAGLVDKAKAVQSSAELISRATDNFISSSLTETVSRADRQTFLSLGRVGWRRFALVATAMVAIVGLFSIIIIATNCGTLEIKVHDDENIRVAVEKDGEQVTIVDTKSNQRVRLHAGSYELILEDSKAGLSLNTDSFTLRRGEEVVVEVRHVRDPDRLAAEWALKIGGKVTVFSPGMARQVISDLGELPEKAFVVQAVDLCEKQMVTDDDLRKLKELKKLQELDLTRARITDKGLLELKGLTDLRQLRTRKTIVS